MAINNISTYQIFQQTLGNVSSVESNLTTEQEQLSSGNQYQSFAEMGGQSEQYLSLSDNISRTNQYLSDHQEVEATVNTTASLITQQIIPTVTGIQSLIANRINGVDTQGFGNELTSAWQELTGELNTSVSGQYIFSGSATNTPPVDTSQFPSSTTPDLSYYAGNSQSLTTRLDDNTVISYNVTAGAEPFQQIFAGLAMAQEGDANNDSTTLGNAENLIAQGLAGLNSVQATVGATSSQLVTSDKNLNNQLLYYQGLQQTIGNTDIVSVSTQLAVNQGILQAAFEAFSKITSLSLSNYLK